MSDTFDHEGDAWASLDWEQDPDDPEPWTPIRGWGKRRYQGRPPPIFRSDPLYYHQHLTFRAIEAETEKSYLIDGLWIPKKICKHLEKHSVWVHSKTFKDILAAHKL